MKRHGFIVGLLLATAMIGVAATNDLTTTLQKGLFEEEANHNLGAAIQLYQTVVTQFDKDRKLAATAVFRLGECYRKQGKTNEATAQYERVLREFPDQGQLAGISRQNLLALGGSLPGTAAPTVPAAAREEQKRLLLQEIKLVEEQLETEQKHVSAGMLQQDSVRTIERELLKLKRQLAGLEAAEPQASEVVASSERPAGTLAEAEEVRRIKAMIKDSPDLINAGVNEVTPLTKAAMGGQLTVARFLLGAGADPEIKDVHGQTALYWAAAQGHKGIVELLLANKAQVENANKSGRTALHAASERGFRSVVEVLVANGAKVDAVDKGKATPLHFAVASGYRAVAELLLEKGADVNVNASAIGGLAGTALHAAAQRADLAMTELLLKQKANPNLVTENGSTPLHLAAKAGHLPVAAALLAHGASVDARTTDEQARGWTALHYAVSNGWLEMIELLLKNKADPNARIESGFAQNALVTQVMPLPPGRRASPSGVGYTPLLMATFKCAPPDTVQALLSAKADPNVKSESGDTPLINAITSCSASSPERSRIFTLLLSHGASPEAIARDGNPALLLAADQRDRELLEILLKHKANPNAKSKNSFTALHYLATQFSGSGSFLETVPMAKQLIAAKADVNAQDREGKTPLKYLSSLASRWTGETAETMKQFADLLRQAGAVEDVPQLDRIEVARPSINFREVVFWKGSNDLNQFSLFELVAVQYRMCAVPAQPANPGGGGPPSYGSGFGPGGAMAVPGPIPMRSLRVGTANDLAFPDFSKLVIRRAAPDGKSRKDLRVDLATIFQSSECSGDMQLKWGDVVEIPEADHPINVNWQSLPEKTRTLLATCLTRAAEVRVKDQSTNMVLQPFGDRPGPAIDFSLDRTLKASGLLRASSDLARVKVTRHDRTLGQSYEMQVDCSSSGNANEIWVRDGDVIEVPEKQ